MYNTSFVCVGRDRGPEKISSCKLPNPVLGGDFEGFINGVVHDNVSHQISNWRAHCHATKLLNRSCQIGKQYFG